jgi:hypothetical protein
VAATVGLDFERRLDAPSFDTRRSIAESLRHLGFELTADQLTRLEAKRGSLVGSSLMIKKQMPVRAIFEVSSEPNGCLVVGHLTDNLRSWMGKTWGVNRQYRDIFDEIRRGVDVGLAGLDGASAESFGEPTFWSRVSDVAVLEQTNIVTSKAAAGAGAAVKALERPKSTTPSAWKGVDSVTFTSDSGVASMTLAETQARLGVAVMVVSHPGSMPPNLSRDVESFAAQVEQSLTAAGGKAVSLEVSGAQRPVMEFLDQQAEIRSALPLRTLHICRSCRLERITNPEYERIAARNEKLGHLMAGVGATVGKGGISPTFVLGQVFKLKRLDPAYVCSRCQGLEADERVVTFCPNCAQLQRDVVLRTCTKCSFDFRTRAGKAPLWREPVVEPDPQPEPEATTPAATTPAATTPAATTPAVSEAPEAAAAPEAAVAPADPAPQAAPAHAYEPPDAAWPTPSAVPLGTVPAGRTGKRCQMCRRDFPTLWRVVIGTPAGFEERFICGTNLTCQMTSLVPAVRV